MTEQEFNRELQQQTRLNRGICELETDHLKLTIQRSKKKKNEKNDESLCVLWDIIKATSHVPSESQKKRGRKGQETHLKK